MPSVTNALITEIIITNKTSGGANLVHSSQVGVEISGLDEQFRNLLDNASITLGPVTNFIMIETTSPLTATLTLPNSGGSHIVSINTLLLLTTPLTGVVINNNSGSAVGVKIVQA